MPVAGGQESSGDKKESVSPGTGVEGNADKVADSDKEKPHREAGPQGPTSETAKGPVSEGRDFLKLAGPEAMKKKEIPAKAPYGSYWTSLYGGRETEGETDEQEGKHLRPSFSPYYAEPVKPQVPEKSQEPLAPKELQLVPLTPPPLSEFEEVDFAKFASGSYVSEYADKFVKMKCRFASLAPGGMRLDEFPTPGYVNFLVTGTGSTMFSLTVVMPSGKAGKVFGLESQKEIILYGRAVKLGLNELTLLVEEVEMAM